MNSTRLASRVSALKPSPTLGITARANALKAAGQDVISFAAGEPDFNTPDPICRSAVAAIDAGFTKYTPSSGIRDLREAIAEKLGRENSVHVSPDQVIVSCGAKHSVYNCMQVLVEPGDEVILFAPYWMTYAEQVRLAGGIPVIVHTSPDQGFVPDRAAIQAAITAKTRAIILNSPSNPTGAVFPRSTLLDIAATAVRHGLWVVADEIYERLVYGVEHVSVAALGNEVAERTITVGGCSKTFSMTGWRVGFAAAPLAVAKAMSNFQDQVTSNPTSFAQKGAVTAFRMPANEIQAMVDEFTARRNLILGLLLQIPDLKVPVPLGAFYVFPDFDAYLQGGSDVELAEYLLEAAGVATVPGSVFEGNGHIRLSYAASRADIERGVARLSEALSRRKS